MTNAISYAAQAAAIASDLIEAKKCEDKANTLREGVNKQVAVMHKDKVVVGRRNKCAIADAFFKTLTEGGLSHGTAANYLTTFRDAVKTGKPVTDWNPNRKDPKPTVQSGTSTKGKKEFADLFRPAFNHDKGNSFMALCKMIEKDYKDDKIKTLYAGFVEYFKSEGDQIEE